MKKQKNIATMLLKMASLIMIGGMLICGVGFIITAIMAIDNGDLWSTAITFLVGVPGSLVTSLLLFGFADLLIKVEAIAKTLEKKEEEQ
jgi:hypothetical protein